jgi:hypothetical protein
LACDLAGQPDLAELVTLWPKLPPEARKTIVKLARVSLPES